MNRILVKDYMKEAVPSVRPDTTVSELINSLREYRLIGSPVVDENQKIVGFVSEQDCIKKMLDSSYYCQTAPTVAEVMRTDVLMVEPDDSIIEIASKMMEGKPKIYPVVVNRKLVGIISRTELLKALDENREDCMK